MNGAMNGKAPTPAVLDRPRARQHAAKALAIALQTRYRRFLESAGDDDATVIATGDLAQCMYENIEFVLWALKVQGGMNPPPPQELRKITPPRPLPQPANDAPKPALELPCTCPPLEPGIIVRSRHMTSCPKFVP